MLAAKSYLPKGRLRSAVASPAADDGYTDLAIQHYFD